MPGAIAAAGAVTIAAEMTVTTLDQSAQQPQAPLSPERIPLRIIPPDLLDTLEATVDDRGEGIPRSCRSKAIRQIDRPFSTTASKMKRATSA